MFRAMGLNELSDRMAFVVIPGAPWSKSRPRFARSGRTYTPKADVDAEQRTAEYLRTFPKFTGNVALGCIFFRPNRQRIDADNMLKHVCDAATKAGIWDDDSQVTAIMAVVELDAEDPRTVVVLGDHRSTLVRGSDAVELAECGSCGVQFERPVKAPSLPRKRTCSPECAIALRGGTLLDDLVPCGHCGIAYRRRTAGQQYCGNDCRNAARTGAARAKSTPKSTCLDCGKQLDHRRGGRCRSCWRKAIASSRPASEIPTAPRGNARSKRKPKRALPIPTGFEACGCGTGIRPVGLAECRRCSQQHAVAK